MTALFAAPVLAQDQGGNNRGGDRQNRGNDQGGGQGRGGGNFDPAQFRQQFEDRVKEQLGASDDEWKVIQPKLTKVFDAQRASRGSMRGMFGRNRDRGGDTSSTDNTNRSPLEIAQRELQQVLDNKDSTADQITAKLKALREARDKARAELASAQKDLKEILTPRQEAVLVNMSMLD
jgi:Spy/CpxP family protein refolding chaperone